MDAHTVLGMDIGSVSVGIALLSPGGEIRRTGYAFHEGQPAQTLVRLLTDVNLQAVRHVAVTAGTPRIVHHNGRFDDQVCAITAARQLHPQPAALLMVGGEKFQLVRFAPSGDYAGTRSNTSCAAGTGSFLDQQAKRLKLGSAAELGRLAMKNTGRCPRIASRCAVFAKTDLIHAQQEGYSVAEISDGLCQGLARNIVDTVFRRDRIEGPVVFCGGVALNDAVREHIRQLTAIDLRVDAHAPLYGAIGAALSLQTVMAQQPVEGFPAHLVHPEDLLRPVRKPPAAVYPPLALTQSTYPEFSSLEACHFAPRITAQDADNPIEVDIYEALPGGKIDVYLGIDIGSTSTKAVIADSAKRVLAGFYTRTAGRPLLAVQSIFEALADIGRRKGLYFHFLGSGTTGSGRKFIGALIGADLVLDEITAHARAACELNPAVDTIIEIGGQDAKFTTLKDGMVTSATMNTVCAAGTGSFIEEQALKLGCPLGAYSARTEGRTAPMASDRCTVFMERDINNYLNEGCAVDDVLAAVLHSVRENYLLKVANESRIGEVIFFQGATARNKALVAAFEQRLKKPILVSKFCHLTGALGTALMLADEAAKKTGPAEPSRFRGLDLYHQEIPLRSEVCSLCSNHCKLTVAEISGETVAYGFLCGRDYATPKFVNKTNGAFDPLRQQRKAFTFDGRPTDPGEITIGIPAALHLVEDLQVWKCFFNRLGINVVTSEGFKDGVKAGKNLTGAEFCAPITDLHGHARHLLAGCDHLFLPFYFEDKQREKEVRRHYCYYTQYAPALVAALDDGDRKRVLSPLVRYLYTSFHTKIELYRMLKGITRRPLSFFEVAAAFDQALEMRQTARKRLQAAGRRRLGKRNDIQVVLLGRPYNILSPSLNSGIPRLFASLGIDCFTGDMMPPDDAAAAPIRPLLDEIHWRHAARILETAEKVARTPGLYPVYITSFKCSPDSFAVDYFKKIMAAHDKPYLVLELDEHDSSVGYETRIEAGIRAFRNHHAGSTPATAASYRSLNPAPVRDLRDKTIILPNWDDFACPLLAANLRREGYDARVMTETPASIQKSLRFNTGQCIPLNAVAQGFMDCIEHHGLDPAKCVLWMSKACIACNIRLYPHHIKTILNGHGRGFEMAGVYVGDLSFMDISLRAAVNTYFAHMFGGLLRRAGCKIRPYETTPGETERALGNIQTLFIRAFEGRIARERALERMIDLLRAIRTRPAHRPQVAIFGDLYSRDNAVMNQDLIRFIETHGGEVVTTPYNQFARMVAGPYYRKWFKEGRYIGVLATRGLLAAIGPLERQYHRYFQQVLREPEHTYDDPPEAILARYGLRIEHTGESMENLLKIHYLKKYYPDISLFVQASPALCCPSLVTEAMAADIERVTGVPVVSITYDGTGGSKNRVVIPYLQLPRGREEVAGEFSRGLTG